MLKLIVQTFIAAILTGMLIVLILFYVEYADANAAGASTDVSSYDSRISFQTIDEINYDYNY